MGGSAGRDADGGGRQHERPSSIAPSSRRCRSSTWSRPCSTRPSRSPRNEYDEWGDPSDAEYYRLHPFLFAVRQRPCAALPVDAGDRGLVGQPGAVLRARRNGSRSCVRRRPTTIRCCCTSRWTRVTAANQGASSATARPRWSTPSSWRSSASSSQRRSIEKKGAASGEADSRRLSYNQRGEHKNINR